MKEQVLEPVKIKAHQERIAGFLMDQVIDPKGEYHFNPAERMVPNQDEHLYDI